MRFLVAFACLLAASNGASLRSKCPSRIFPNGKIVGGSEIDINSRPYQVALEDSGYLFCGGSIISANYVLTAAHCTDGAAAQFIKVRFGTNALESGGSSIQVASLVQNPNFSQNTLDSDVSVLRLSSAIPLSNSVQPVVLRNKEAGSGEIATVSGWGVLSAGGDTLANILQAVEVPVVTRDSCNGAYNGDITNYMICAGEAGKDSCQGDSGGPLTVEDQQVGIVSWGYGCAFEGYPGVYTNIAALKFYINDNSNNEATWA